MTPAEPLETTPVAVLTNCVTGVAFFTTSPPVPGFRVMVLPAPELMTTSDPALRICCFNGAELAVNAPAASTNKLAEFWIEIDPWLSILWDELICNLLCRQEKKIQSPRAGPGSVSRRASCTRRKS